jgi:hypothetical protein
LVAHKTALHWLSKDDNDQFLHSALSFAALRTGSLRAELTKAKLQCENTFS